MRALRQITLAVTILSCVSAAPAYAIDEYIKKAPAEEQIAYFLMKDYEQTRDILLALHEITAIQDSFVIGMGSATSLIVAMGQQLEGGRFGTIPASFLGQLPDYITIADDVNRYWTHTDIQSTMPLFEYYKPSDTDIGTREVILTDIIIDGKSLKWATQMLDRALGHSHAIQPIAVAERRPPYHITMRAPDFWNSVEVIPTSNNIEWRMFGHFYTKLAEYKKEMAWLGSIPRERQPGYPMLAKALFQRMRTDPVFAQHGLCVKQKPQVRSLWPK